ncbi:nucleoside hydrolase [Kribbella sp. NPDC056951]|uniref:nucleoside hydrolase n=1 Tax=Kribbella sp. NPDC056951 TaxID=3345978 RepID=UPI0036366673
MGRTRGQDPREEWTALAGLGETFDEFGDLTESLLETGPPPSGVPGVARAPMIIDTDCGGDPDDAVALVVAGLRVPELRLVVTGDEVAGERARFVRYLLDLVGRTDVEVVAGADLGNRRLWFMEGVTPASAPGQRTDVVEAVAEACAGVEGPVRWVGMGPLTNLAAVQDARPELLAQLQVTQMGGAIVYRDPSRAEHNFRMDPAAAIRMVPILQRWEAAYVVSDVTFNPATEITTASPLYKRWAEPDSPDWAKVLRTHTDRWLQRYPGSMQHDAMTLAAAMLWPGIRFATERVALDDLARMSRSDDGVEIEMSVSVDYPAFMAWLAAALAW